jgi:hypothetical protein
VIVRPGVVYKFATGQFVSGLRGKKSEASPGKAFREPCCTCRALAGIIRSVVEGSTPLYRLYEELAQFVSGFSPDINMVVGPEQARFQLPIRSYPEAVAERTELCIVERPDHLDF